MTKHEYENAVITTPGWLQSHRGSNYPKGALAVWINDNPFHIDLGYLLIPMYRAGFIEGYKDGMFVVQKIDNPGETELVDVDAFMVQNVDMAFCESILKYL